MPDWHGPAIVVGVIVVTALVALVGRKRFQSYFKAVETGDVNLFRDQYQLSTVLFLLKNPGHYVRALQRIERSSSQLSESQAEAIALTLSSLIDPRDVIKASSFPGPVSRHGHEFLHAGREHASKIREVVETEPRLGEQVDPDRAVCLLCVVAIADYSGVPRSTSSQAVIDAFRDLTDQPQKDNTFLKVICLPHDGSLLSESEGRDLFQKAADACSVITARG